MRNLFLLLIFFLFISALKAEKEIIIQSTTSLKNSGFYNFISPLIYKDLGIRINVVAVGTGAAIRNSMNCDGDLLIVHSPQQEKLFIDSGYANQAHYIMHNYFIVIGPKKDPAKIEGLNVKNAFTRIFQKQSYFISRGDNSGTDNKEKAIWRSLKLNPLEFSVDWYLETGTNMGSTINVAVGLNAYTFTDKATWISFNNKLDFKIYVDNDDYLINKYSVLKVSKKKCPHSKLQVSSKVLSWLISSDTQNKIIKFKKNNKQLFFIK